MVSEREMMKVAGCIGNNWRQVGIMALGMNTTTLQQIEEDNKLHKERVFAMLRKWSIRERDQATATRLYSLLTQEDYDVDPQNINFLMENNWADREDCIYVALCMCKHAGIPLEGAITAIQLNWKNVYFSFVCLFD